jgi:hypothetical protein
MGKKNCRITCMADGCIQPIDGSFFSQILGPNKFAQVARMYASNKIQAASAKLHPLSIGDKCQIAFVQR